MTENDKIIASGPFKGRKIEFAPTTGTDLFSEIAKDFMNQIFDFEPGEYLITDESSLFDFTGLDEMELPEIYKKIEEIYDLDVSDISSGSLLKIFIRIHRNKSGTTI